MKGQLFILCIGICRAVAEINKTRTEDQKELRVVTELNYLRRENCEMKSQLINVTLSLLDLQTELKIYKETLHKTERVIRKVKKDVTLKLASVRASLNSTNNDLLMTNSDLRRENTALETRIEALTTKMQHFETTANGFGELQFASYYQDHMVLQRGPQQAVVWGHATKIDDSVTVTVSGHAAVTGKVTKDAVGKGIWKVKLPAITDRGPFTIIASSSEGLVTIKDVLFGDVWLCGGQSNMEFEFHGVVNHSSELVTALKFKDVRFMKVNRRGSPTPLTELTKGTVIKWTKPTSTLNYFSAVCWFFGEYLYSDVKYPVGLIESDWGGTPIESWSSSDALAACPQHGKRHSILWNAMINPLLGLTIYGALWYQGESNAGRHNLYACQFPAMINDWRKKFHDASLGETSAEFPFGFVQLAGYRQSTTIIGGFPPLRWSQTAKLGEVPNNVMKNVFMAVAMDLPDYHSPFRSIHPRYKQDISSRLKLGARAVAYNDSTVKYQGPFPKTITQNETNRSLHIVYKYGPIQVKNNHGFEVCCSASTTKCGAHDHWAAAPIQSHRTSDVIISTSGCGTKHVVGVRYAWRESPCDFKQCAIYGSNTSLPAPPYIHTDGFGAGAHIIGK